MTALTVLAIIAGAVWFAAVGFGLALCVAAARPDDGPVECDCPIPLPDGVGECQHCRRGVMADRKAS